jgi:hypothetical protein
LISALLLGFLVFLSSCAGPSTGATDRDIDIGTHKVHIYSMGQGTPAVVIDTGITETYESWLPLIGTLRPRPSVKNAGLG